MEVDYQKLYRSLTCVQEACNYYQTNQGCKECPMADDTAVCQFIAGVCPSSWILREPRIMR